MVNRKLLTVAALVLGLGIGAAASTGTAQETGKPAAQPPTNQPGAGMMGGGMMGDMSRMMENCNRMMEMMMQRMPAQPGATTPQQKG